LSKSAYWKDIFREIPKSIGRYLSLIIITALGSASVVGILATSLDMRAVADKTYKQRNLYDIQIKSSTGFSDDDISALREIPGVDVVMPTNVFDVYVYFDDETRTMRSFALPGALNDIEITEGRLPANSVECAIDDALLRQHGLVIGDSVAFGLDDMSDYFDMLSSNEFKIVGTVTSPFFIIPESRGTTSLGDGRLDYYMYLHPSAYKQDISTDAYILMEGSRDMDNLSDDYYDVSDEWVRLIEPTGDIRVQAKEQEFIDAQTEIDDGWQEYIDGVAELDEKVADARRELDDAQTDLDDARQELEKAQIDLEEAQTTLDEKIADAQAEIDKNALELKNGRAEIDKNRAELENSQVEIDQGRGLLLTNLQQLETTAPYGASPELDAQYDILYTELGRLDYAQSELDAGMAQLEAAEIAIVDGEAKLRNARATLERERADAQKEIDDGWAETKDGWAELADGLTEWQDGVKTLEREEADALTELSDAKLELEDAQETLDAAPTPEWFYFTRQDNHAFDSYCSDTSRLESIGYVFPLVFFVVAALVSLTTMTRMVDEQRTLIGIYKALGYGTLRIAFRLLLYAFSAGVTGGLVGVIVGSNLFPRVIFGAYLHMYEMPPIDTPIPTNISLIAIATSVSLVVVVTFATSLRSMRTSPAEMMRPKTPQSGKKVFIEKIPFIWGFLKFSGKVTARNILRYKKRFIMSLAGVAGCTAILLTSFGLRDSLAAISDLQYGKVVSYTSQAYLKEITSEIQRAGIDAYISGDRLYIREESLSADGCAYPVSMMVPESSDRLGEFINLYSRKSGETVPLTSDGILVSEKLARELGISEGDSFSFTSNSSDYYTVQVTGVIENYVLHYIYMSPEMYTELFDAEPLFNSVLIVSSDDSVGMLTRSSDVRAIVYTADLKENISDSTDALGIVAIVLIILACSLAFVVLFNLTNINITERIRELATIKVLGFYDEELAMYIYRENVIVTLLGIALGLVAGIFLHAYVLKAAEIDLLMFPRIILFHSYIYSVGLSIVFAVFVNLVMYIKLSRINMVESLKNVE